MSSAEIVARRNLHLKGLQRIHPDVLEIIDDIPHVALYRYVLETGKWTRMEIEGSAYITRNSQSPLYSLIIMNKKGADDLILHILNNVEKVKLQDQYLMIKCTHENETKIFGIWIHDEETRKKSKEALERILKSASEPTSNNLIQKLSNLKLGTVSLNPDSKKKAEDPIANGALQPEEKPAQDQSLKSVQLLSLLKKPAVPIPAQAQAPVYLISQSEPEPPKKTKNSSITSSPSNQKAEQLLALIKPLASNESTPPKAELLTDGDIARKINSKPPAVPAESNVKTEKKIAATTLLPQQRAGGGAALLALLKDTPPTGKQNSSVQPAPNVCAIPQAESSATSVQPPLQKKTITPPIPTKKPLLISPSDLEI